MREAFLEFLSLRTPASADALSRVRRLIDGAAEPIGRIAYSYGVLSSRDIEEILERQREKSGRFGEIAIGMGLLTQERLEALLLIQELRHVSAITEALVLCDAASTPDILKHTGQFMLEAAQRVAVEARPA